MGKWKTKLQDGTINIPGLIVKVVLIWFIFSFLVFSECESDYSGIFPGWPFFSGSGGKDHEVPKSYRQFEEQLYFGGCFHYYGEYFRYFNRSVYRILRY